MSRRGKNDPAFSLFAFQDIITSVTGIMILVTLILALELMERVASSPTQRTADAIEGIESAMHSVSQVEATITQNQLRIAELQARLANTTEQIGEVASVDQRGVQADVDDMHQMDTQLAADLRKLAERLSETTRQKEQLDQQMQEFDPEAVKQMLEDVKEKERQLDEMKNRIIFNPTDGDAKVPWLVEVTSTGFTVAKTGVSAPPTTHASAAAFQAWAQNRDKSSEYFVLLVKPDGIANFERAQPQLRQLGFDVGYDLLDPEQVAIDPETGASAP